MRKTHNSKKRPINDLRLGSTIAHDLSAKKPNIEIVKQAPSIPFVLPRVQLDFMYVEEQFTLQHAEHTSFSRITLAWALQQNFSYEAIEHYVRSYSPKSVRESISFTADGKTEACSGVELASLIFYAVERNCAKSVRLLLEYGADANAVVHPYKVPALAFAILHAEHEYCNTTSVVTTLLSLGASSFSIPKGMWQDYLNVPQAETAASNQTDVDVKASWCNKVFRTALVRTLTLSQRYFLAKAATLKLPTVRMKQLAKAHKITPLLEVPYHLIGQAPATTMLLSKAFAHIALCANTPLILLYAGPSRHGKTELAKQMGRLISVDSHVADCTELRYETDMFGPKPPYQGHAEGSPLNNYLAQHSGERSIVFLDEFEKTTREVGNALLLVFDSGTYRDRRSGNALDCSKTIWVLASNHGQEAIIKFYNKFMRDQAEEVRAKAPFASLDHELKEAFARDMGAPLTGRFSLIVPFFPFSPGEQAVVAHKFLLDTVDEMRQPIDLQAKRLVGHVHLLIHNDGQLSTHLAKIGYEENLGARSIYRAVAQHVHARLVEKYMEGHTEIVEETNTGPLQKYGVHLQVIGSKEKDVVVNKEGFTSVRVKEGIKDPDL